MTIRSGAELPDALTLTRALEKFRGGQGLTLSRLQADRSEATARLLGLAATRRRASIDETGLAAATLAVLTECVRDDMSGTHQIVADAVLGLGVCSLTYSRAGLDAEVIRDLAADSAGTRRRALLANWRRLHEAVRQAVEERPSASLLQGVVEPAALRELADQLIRREVYSVGSRTAAAALEGLPVTSEPSGSTGKVVVVGGAVMDATFRTKALPVPETSSQAHGFELSPGGKGLTQAVAAAKLGLEVSLLAAVADDRFGQEIMRHLRDEGVDTSLIKLVPEARTPFTGVFEMELGDSIAVNWRNDSQVSLDPGDIEARSQVLTDCDAVLLTFEVPRDTAECTLALAHTDAQSRPLTIVTPGQPYSEGAVSRRALSQIDYLVAHAWELGAYAPPRLETFDPDPVARHLLSCGVETLCLLVGGGCTIYSQAAHDTLSVPAFPSIYKESSVARDAFCAALAARLIDNDRVFSGQVALWATAAMSCAVADFPLSDSMPDRRRVETLLERSVFGVSSP
jgi:ribokinase